MILLLLIHYRYSDVPPSVPPPNSPRSRLNDNNLMGDRTFAKVQHREAIVGFVREARVHWGIKGEALTARAFNP